MSLTSVSLLQIGTQNSLEILEDPKAEVVDEIAAKLGLRKVRMCWISCVCVWQGSGQLFSPAPSKTLWVTYILLDVSSCYIFWSETQIQRAFLSTGPFQGSVAAVAGTKQHKLHLPFLSPATGAIPGSISLASANLAQIELELPLGSVSRSKGCPWIVFPSLVLQGVSGVWGYGCRFQPAAIPSGFPDFLTSLQPALMFSGLGAALVWWECQEWDVHKQDLTCWRKPAWEKAQCRL